MDMEEVYLRQITEYLKKQNELQEANNALLRELLQKLSNQKKDHFYGSIYKNNVNNNNGLLSYCYTDHSWACHCP